MVSLIDDIRWYLYIIITEPIYQIDVKPFIKLPSLRNTWLDETIDK